MASSVRSVRLPDESWKWAEDYAEKRGLTRNGVIALAVESLRGDAVPEAGVEMATTAGHDVTPRSAPTPDPEYRIPKIAPRR